MKGFVSSFFFLFILSPLLEKMTYEVCHKGTLSLCNHFPKFISITIWYFSKEQLTSLTCYPISMELYFLVVSLIRMIIP